MTRLSFAQDLETAAARIGELDRAEIATLLRRAALRLRNVETGPAAGRAVEAPVGDDIRDALGAAAKEMGKTPDEALAVIVRDWLIGHGYLEWDESEQ